MAEAAQKPDPNVKWSDTLNLDRNNPRVPVRIRMEGQSVYLEWQPNGAWEWAKADSLTPHALQMLLNRLTFTVMEQAEHHQASENKHLDDHLALSSESRSRGVLIKNVEEEVDLAGVPKEVPTAKGTTHLLECRVEWLRIQYEKLTTELELKRGLVAYAVAAMDKLEIPVNQMGFRARIDALVEKFQEIDGARIVNANAIKLQKEKVDELEKVRQLNEHSLRMAGEEEQRLKERILELEGDPTAPIAHWRGLANSLQAEADEVKAFLAKHRVPERVEDLQEHEMQEHPTDGPLSTMDRLTVLFERWRFNLAYYDGVTEVLTTATGPAGRETMKGRVEMLVNARDHARSSADRVMQESNTTRQEIIGQLVAAGLPSTALENRTLPEAVALYLKRAPLSLATVPLEVRSVADLRLGKQQLSLKAPEGINAYLTGLATNSRSRGLLTYLFTCNRLALVVLEEGPLSEKHRAR